MNSTLSRSLRLLSSHNLPRNRLKFGISSRPFVHQSRTKLFQSNGRWYLFTHIRTFKDFDHGEPKTDTFEAIYALTSVFGLAFVLFLWDPIVHAYAVKEEKKKQRLLRSQAESVETENPATVPENQQASGDEEESENKPKKEKLGFRDRKIIEYENRIRHFSTPDKVFRYFSTLQVTHVHGGQETHEVFMTPDDFLRSMTPGIKQPEGLGLDQYIKYDPKNVHMKLELALDEDSIFFKLGSSGLISFSDYIFLLTVLSTSRRHFEIAFQMFDWNGDGNVDVEEFETVATLIRQQTSIGSRHRDHANTGNTFKGVNSALSTYFFGETRDKKLTIEKFLDFQCQLQKEILSLEFQRKEPDENGKITEADFTELLLAYAGYPPKKKSRITKRVKKTFKENSQGISKDDYLKFFHFLNNINDVDTALTFYHIANASISQSTLKHVAKTVAHVDLGDHVIDVVFTIFDENQDGQLSNKEFIAVMKNRLLRGLEKPKDTGFVKFIQSVIKCSKEEISNFRIINED